MSKTQQEAKRLYLIPCIQGYESTKDPKNSKPILFLFLFFLNGVFFFLGGGVCGGGVRVTYNPAPRTLG